jgi:hypothetical protein
LSIESPVQPQAFRVDAVLLNDQPFDERHVVAAGAKLKLTGRVKSGERPLREITPMWPAQPGERVAGSEHRPGDKPCSLDLQLHGAYNQERLGVILYESVLNRPLGKSGEESEILVEFTAPKSPGTYVVDLRVNNMFEVRATRSSGLPTKAPGQTIWRRELVVE